MLGVACVALVACSEFFAQPTATPVPTPTPKPSFGIAELRNVFQNLPAGYVEVDPRSRELGSANFNDSFGIQLAFVDREGRSKGFSVSLGILNAAEQEEFDYTLEKRIGTADVDVIPSEKFGRTIGLFRPYGLGMTALGIRDLELPARSGDELRELLMFRRGEVAVVVQFAEPAWPHNVYPWLISDAEELMREMWQAQCGGVYICYDSEPDFVTGPQAARMIDEAIVQFYGDTPVGE